MLGCQDVKPALIVGKHSLVGGGEGGLRRERAGTARIADRDAAKRVAEGVGLEQFALLFVLLMA